MHKINFLLILILLTFSLCSSGNKKPSQDTTNLTVDNEATSAPEQKPNNSHPGKDVYTKYCFACHQMDGSGVPGMYPPIQKTDWASGDKKRLILLVLEGMKGPIKVNGEEFNQTMPSHSFLSDQQIADVLTYIRQNFGNKADAVTVQEVTKLRK